MTRASRLKSTPADASRRAFIAKAAAVPVAAVAGTVIVPHGETVPAPPAPHATEQDRGRYRLSEHVRTYYRTAAF
jgi:hypothetical protein